MKSETVLNPLAEPSPKLEPERTEVVQSDTKATLGKIQQLRETPLPRQGPDHTELVGYPHWGINE